MNLAEIRGFCSSRGIPYRIVADYPNGKLLTPEYAYLTDLRHRRADGDWKALRKAKARSALATLSRIAPVRR